MKFYINYTKINNLYVYCIIVSCILLLLLPLTRYQLNYSLSSLTERLVALLKRRFYSPVLYERISSLTEMSTWSSSGSALVLFNAENCLLLFFLTTFLFSFLPYARCPNRDIQEAKLYTCIYFKHPPSWISMILFDRSYFNYAHNKIKIVSVMWKKKSNQ